MSCIDSNGTVTQANCTENSFPNLSRYFGPGVRRRYKQRRPRRRRIIREWEIKLTCTMESNICRIRTTRAYEINQKLNNTTSKINQNMLFSITLLKKSIISESNTTKLVWRVYLFCANSISRDSITIQMHSEQLMIFPVLYLAQGNRS